MIEQFDRAISELLDKVSINTGNLDETLSLSLAIKNLVQAKDAFLEGYFEEPQQQLASFAAERD